MHLKMDAFYAAAEQRDDPRLRGRPAVVGARPGEVDKVGLQSRLRALQRSVPSALLIGALGLWVLPIAATAAPILRCEVDQGGTAHTVEAAPVSDPYGVQGVDINGRFRFKAVVVGDADRVDYVAIYTWYLGDGRPVLLHEAKYQAPAARPDPTPTALTGQHYLYAPGLEREFQYGCALVDVAR